MGMSRKDVAGFFERLANKFDCGITIEIVENEFRLTGHNTVHFIAEENGEDVVFQEHTMSQYYECDIRDGKAFVEFLDQIDKDRRELRDRNWGMEIVKPEKAVDGGEGV